MSWSSLSSVLACCFSALGRTPLFDYRLVRSRSVIATGPGPAVRHADGEDRMADEGPTKLLVAAPHQIVDEGEVYFGFQPAEEVIPVD